MHIIHKNVEEYVKCALLESLIAPIHSHSLRTRLCGVDYLQV